VPLPYNAEHSPVYQLSCHWRKASGFSSMLTEGGSGHVERDRESEGSQEDRGDEDRVSLEEGVVEDLSYRSKRRARRRDMKRVLSRMGRHGVLEEKRTR
jgi:hypothetical protein